MSTRTREEFESAFPLPKGVTFDGDHYVANTGVLGAFSNATIWSHMYRGWRKRQETLCIELPVALDEPDEDSFDGDYEQYEHASGLCYEVNKTVADCRAAIHEAGVRTC